VVLQRAEEQDLERHALHHVDVVAVADHRERAGAPEEPVERLPMDRQRRARAEVHHPAFAAPLEQVRQLVGNAAVRAVPQDLTHGGT